jgi:hypothetical protein
MKRKLYQFIQHLAASTFIGLSVYGLIIFMGGEVNKHLPFWTSLSLGLGAVVCIAVVVYMGGILDRMAVEQAAEEEGQEY